MWIILHDLLERVLFPFGMPQGTISERESRRLKAQYENPKARPRLEPGETGGYLWDKNAQTWVYDPEATADEVIHYTPGGY